MVHDDHLHPVQDIPQSADQQFQDGGHDEFQDGGHDEFQDGGQDEFQDGGVADFSSDVGENQLIDESAVGADYNQVEVRI